ncbi:MAG: Ig-like domain-containing protein [Candidatus Dojkabacteria bacterium]
MNNRNAPSKSKRKSIFLTFLLLLSIPIFVYGLIQDSNFDIRNRAFEEIEVSERNPCVISFPNVNPYSLEIDKTFRIQVDALSVTLGIQAISIKDANGEEYLTKTYEDMPKTISESFSFTPRVAREYSIEGIMVDMNKKSYECVISSPYDIDGVRAISTNSKPVFTTQPKDSKPSQSIKTGDIYEYTLIAEDIDKDTINYSFSFTKGANWLKPTVIEDGGGGKLTIKFKGSSQEPASYLANIFIHDGYSDHLSSQSWVISVSPLENDNPKVKITSPIHRTTIITEPLLNISWDASDDNQIIKYEVYASQNPTNEKSWITLSNNIPYNTTSYQLNTKLLKDGTYRIIVKAIDNQKPEGVGMDISQEIVIAKGQKDGKLPDDFVTLDKPQVVNFSPTSSDTVENRKPTIKASLIASAGERIIPESIKVLLDNQEITKEIKINQISDSEYTVIYLPTENITKGVHKVEIKFSDSSNEEIEKSWTFTIGSKEDTENYNIFGYLINKRVALIVAGGIALVVLAIFVPIIIFAVWKDDSERKESRKPTLPPSIPKDNIVVPAYTKPPDDEIEVLVSAPQPTEEKIPEPDTDLNILLEQIEDSKEERK